tara:strand:- start:105 stop:356 length:252 start_codon:yes stop_codon:yes gene_type:complete
MFLSITRGEINLSDKKKHHTQLPHNVVKRALDKQGYTHAAALSYLIGKSIPDCIGLLSGETPFQGNGLPRIAEKLGIDPEDLR